jgi:hypothetical protein
MHATDGFHPHPLLRGGHRQTALGYWLRRLLRFTLPAEDLVVEAGGGVRLLLRATWQDGPREDRPALLIVHGLGGSDASAYVVSAGRHAYARGWHVVRMNMRGSGDGFALCPLLYNAGLDTDLTAALSAVAAVVPRVAVLGFSLGANLALLALGRRRAELPPGLVGLAAVSPPLDLSACAGALEAPGNGLYQSYVMRMLAEGYRQRHQARPDLFAAGTEIGLRTVREYDDRITAPFGGYESAAQYYARSSAGPWLREVDRPALVLAAADDPMIPVESLTRFALSPSVQREVLPTGGHVGFVSRAEAPGWFWAPQRAIAFLEGAAGLPTRGPRAG